MSGFLRLNRRQMLASSFAASCFSSLARGTYAADEPKKPKKPAEPKTFLFVDWFHVKKGDLQVTLDPERLSDEGKKQIETYDREFQKKFDQSGHGYRPVDVPFGVKIVQEVAQRSQPWLLPDQPWERNVNSPSVMYDEGRFRCWYMTRLTGEAQKTTVDQERVMEVSGSALAYAESEDGIKWTKPIRNTLSFQGSRENNLVSGFNNGGSVFRDDHGPAEERYKSFHFDELPKEIAGAGSMAKYGLYGVTSPDGYVWKRNPKPLIRYFSDTVNIGGWDPLLGRYVGYFRHHFSGRTISRAETEDFWEWPQPQPILYAGPLDGPAVDYYTNCYTTYPGDPSLRLMFPSIYHRDSDSVDIRLSISRDGRMFQWVSYDPIIQVGAAGEWDGGSLYAQPDLVQLPDGRLALPYDAYNTTHNEVFFENFYKEYNSTSGIAWALWDDARLAGIEAKEFGQFTANGASFNGKRILINAKTMQAGAVEVELRERGKPVPGFSFGDCVPLSGNLMWSECRWKGEANVATLKGKSLEVAFRLRCAKVFAYRFA